MASPCEMPAGVSGFISFHWMRQHPISQWPKVIISHPKDISLCCPTANKKPPNGRLFLLAEQDGDSNRFPCNSPVGCCSHQFKNWRQPYFSPQAKRQSNPSSSPTIREVQRGCHSEDAKRPWESVLHSNASNLSISGEYGLPHQSADWFAMTGFLTASAI